MKKLLLLVIVLFASWLPSVSQVETNWHDETKMNKFNDIYARKIATYANLDIVINRHRTKADSIMSDLAERATVEATNLADREIDLAYKKEEDKLERAKSAFQNNIDRILPLGGSNATRKNWQELYNLSTYAILVTHSSYLPNAKRRIQYQAIYDDLIKQNDQLTAYLRELEKNKLLKEYMQAAEKPIKAVDKEKAVTAAFGRWSAAMNGGTEKKEEKK